MFSVQFDNLNPFSQEVFEITIINATPPILNGGELLIFTTTVTPETNDSTPENNSATYNQIVVNSYDPNDKMVVQGNEIFEDDIDQYLNYRIRFQNLGTANALNIKVIDTIDTSLDWTTFKPISSSHGYRVEIVNGEQINYYFDDINLPFESADSEGSNGYITYKIKPKATASIGDTFQNTAYIYFDFNLPVVTNTAVTTVVDVLDDNTIDLGQIKLYPIPAKDYLSIALPSGVSLTTINLFDIQGRLVKRFKNQNELELNDIQKGIYF